MHIIARLLDNININWPILTFVPSLSHQEPQNLPLRTMSCPKLPLSLLLLSCQLCILTSHLNHFWGQSLSKAMDGCYTISSSLYYIADLHWEVGLVLCLSSFPCHLTLHASAIVATSLWTLSEASPNWPNEQDGDRAEWKWSPSGFSTSAIRNGFIGNFVL